MDPFVGKVDFHAVDVGDLLACEFLFYGFEDGVDVDVGCKLDFVFGDGVGGIAGLEFRDFLPLLAMRVRKSATPTRASRP